jgi:hypothetical protein
MTIKSRCSFTALLAPLLKAGRAQAGLVGLAGFSYQSAAPGVEASLGGRKFGQTMQQNAG